VPNVDPRASIVRDSIILVVMLEEAGRSGGVSATASSIHHEPTYNQHELVTWDRSKRASSVRDSISVVKLRRLFDDHEGSLQSINQSIN
jgi:ribonuclease D